MKKLMEKLLLVTVILLEVTKQSNTRKARYASCPQLDARAQKKKIDEYVSRNGINTATLMIPIP